MTKEAHHRSCSCLQIIHIFPEVSHELPIYGSFAEHDLQDKASAHSQCHAGHLRQMSPGIHGSFAERNLGIHGSFPANKRRNSSLFYGGKPVRQGRKGNLQKEDWNDFVAHPPHMSPGIHGSFAGLSPGVSPGVRKISHSSNVWLVEGNECPARQGKFKSPVLHGSFAANVPKNYWLVCRITQIGE